MTKFNVISPKWNVPTKVKALTTTRIGGASQSPFASLNLGDHVGDDAEAVDKNRVQLKRTLNLPSEPMWLQQTHSTNVIDISDIDEYSEPADGAFTNKPNKVCAVMTADCLPLFLCNRQGTKVAVVHAGWRGLADGIVEAGIANFNEPAENIYAWSGPAISQRHFEVGLEVKQQLGGPESAYRPSENFNKVYADMYKLVDHRLSDIGVEHNWNNDCTYQDSDRFFSYRRDGQTGRMVSLIWVVG